jgi:hypothetical protein
MASFDSGVMTFSAISYSIVLVWRMVDEYRCKVQ